MSQCATNAGKKEEKLSENNNNKNTRRILGRVFIALGVFFLALFLLERLLSVSPKVNAINIELGDSISSDVHDYLEGREIALRQADIDISNVNLNKCGEYQVIIKYFWVEYDFYVTVKDTISPHVFFNCDNYVCEPFVNIPSDYFIDHIEDMSSVTCSYLNTEKDSDIVIEGDCVSFKSTGVHNVVLRCSDSEGNSSNYYMGIIVDSSPLIYGSKDFYVATGSEVNLLEGMAAFDDTDGDVTSNLSVYVDGDYFTRPGAYEVRYEAKDSYGLTGYSYSTIHSYDPLLLQDLVNRKKINPFVDSVAGVINPYDSGYLDTSDCSLAIENIKNAVVRVHYETSRYRVNGSGYILKIDNDGIIICTNKHVVSDQNTVVISFYDGTNIKGHVVAGESEPDIAFVRVDLQNVPDSLLQTLRTIHINLNYYNSLSGEPQFDMGIYCINEDGSEWITRYGKIVRKSGKLAEYFKGYDYEVTEVSVKLTHGVSGSAIIDAHGNLLCMAAFYWSHNGTVEYYGVSLDDILDYYEEVFGERLEYY